MPANKESPATNAAAAPAVVDTPVAAPDKRSGPLPTSPTTTTAHMPPPNGGKPSRGVEMFAAGPGAGERAQMMHTLQRQVGNTRVANLVRSQIQTKISVGPANDAFEQEADQVANKVTAESSTANVRRRPLSLTVSRISSKGIETPPEEKKDHEESTDHGKLQRNAAGGQADHSAAPASMEDRIKSPSGGQRLPEGVQQEMEGALGTDLSGVRVHTSQTHADDAAHLGARAFTHGSNIFLGANESPHDRKLMAHELTHVVQQGGDGGDTLHQKPLDASAQQPIDASPQKPIADSNGVDQTSPLAEQAAIPTAGAGQKPLAAIPPAAPPDPTSKRPEKAALAPAVPAPAPAATVAAAPDASVTAPVPAATAAALAPDTSAAAEAPVALPELSATPTSDNADPGAMPEPTELPELAPVAHADEANAEAPQALGSEIAPTTAPAPPTPSLTQMGGSATTSLVQRQEDDDSGGILASIKRRINDVVDGLRSGWTSLSQMAAEVLTTIRESVNGMISGLIGIVMGALQVLQSMWTSITSRVTQLVTGLRRQVESALDTVLGVVGAIGQAIMRFDANALRAAWNRLLSVFAGANQRVQQALESVRSTIAGLWQSVRSRFDAVLTTLTSGAANLMTQVRTMVDGARQRLSLAWDSLRNRANQLSGVLGGVLDRLRSLVTSLLSWAEGIWNGIQQQWAALATRVAGWVQQLGALVSAAWENLRQRAMSLWTSLQGLWTRLQQWVGRQVQRVIGGFVTLWNNIRNLNISTLIEALLRYAPFLQAVAEIIKNPNIVLRPIAQSITAKLDSEMPAAANKEARKHASTTAGPAPATATAGSEADVATLQRTIGIQRQPALNEPLEQSVLWGAFWEVLVEKWDDFWAHPLDKILTILWEVIAFWETVPRDWDKMVNDLGTAWSRMFAEGMGFWRHLLDLPLILFRGVTAIAFDLFPLFLLLSVIVGAFAGGIGGAAGGAVLTFMAGGVGAAPGAGVGIAGGAGVGFGFAMGVGEGLLALYVATELLSFLKAYLDLTFVKQTEDEQVQDIEQMVGSAIGLGIAAVLFLLSAIAAELAKSLKFRLRPGSAAERFISGAQRGFRGGSPFRRGRPVVPRPRPGAPRPEFPFEGEVRARTNQVLNGERPLTDLTPSQRRTLANYYDQISETVGGKNAQAARLFNKHRAAFLRGETPEVPGRLPDWMARHGFKSE